VAQAVAEFFYEGKPIVMQLLRGTANGTCDHEVRTLIMLYNIKKYDII
jgi:hypothetical protein